MADKKLQKEWNEWLKANPDATQEQRKAKQQEFVDRQNGIEDPYKGAQKNVAKASAATVAPLNSKKDVSMDSTDVAVQPIIKAQEKVDEAKMKPDIGNQIEVDKAEAEMQEANKQVQEGVVSDLEIQNTEEEAMSFLDRPEIASTDEGQKVREAIDTNDPSKLQELATPEGEPVLPGHYDEQGNWVPYQEAQVEDPRLMSRQMAMLLTVISAAICTMSGGALPPINFMKLDKQDEYIENLNKVHQDYASLVNGTAEKRNEKSVEVEGTEKSLQSAKDNPDLYARENTDALARGRAAEQGSTRLEEVEMNSDLQKALQENQLNMDLKLLQLNQEQQTKMAKLLYDQEVQKVVNTIKARKAEGLSVDEIAKEISSMNGTTKLQRGLGYAKDITGMATDIVNSVTGATSDKKVKTFDAKKPNNEFLKKAFKWR